MPLKRSWRRARSSSARFIDGSPRGGVGSLFDQVAVERELADDVIDLIQAGQRRLAAFEVFPHEAVAAGAGFDGHLAGFVARRRARGARPVRRTCNSGTARRAVAAARASLRRTSPLLAASLSRGCACRPSWLPSRRDSSAPLRATRTCFLSKAFSGRARRRTPPCPCGPGRAPGTEAPPRHSASARRDIRD